MERGDEEREMTARFSGQASSQTLACGFREAFARFGGLGFPDRISGAAAACGAMCALEAAVTCVDDALGTGWRSAEEVDFFQTLIDRRAGARSATRRFRGGRLSGLSWNP